MVSSKAIPKEIIFTNDSMTMYLIDSNHTQCQWNDITFIGSALQGKDILNSDAPRNGPKRFVYLHSL